MYAATSGGVKVLSSSGATATWTVALSGNALSVAVDPRASKTVYASTASGLSKSIDGGGTWSTVTAAPAGNIYGLYVGSSSTVYIAARSGSLISTDGGKTYNPSSGGLWSSADGGKTWTNLGVLAGRDVNGVVHDSATGNVYAGLAGLGVGVLSETASPTPVLAVSPSSLSFSVQGGAANPAAQTVKIANTGAGNMTWSASKKQSWLTLSQTSGPRLEHTRPRRP